MDPLNTRHRVRQALGLIVTGLPLLLLGTVLSVAVPAQASGTITNCSNDSDLQTQVSLGGHITFNCGGTHAAATIHLNDTLAPVDGTILDGANGGHPVVLDGGGSRRVVQITAGRAVTLTHLVVTNGAAVDGSCVDVLGQAELDNVEIHHCAATGSSGGALFIDVGAIAELDNANLHDNSAGVSGGGIYNSTSATLHVNNSTLAHNTAGTDMGAVGDGGGLWNAGYAFVYTSTVFSNTTLVGYGGGLYNQSGLTVQNSTVSDNKAVQSGGGVRNWTGEAILVNSTLSDNQAANGGGAASDGSGSELLLSQTTLLGNQATLFGGGVYHAGTTLSVETSEIKNNSAEEGGGLYTNSAIAAAVQTSTFDGNSASEGGGIANGGQVDILADTFSGNQAGEGAGLENLNSATLTNDTFSGNTATSVGGGVHGVVSSHTLLLNVTIARNTAGTGAALYLDTGAVVTATNTIFAYSLHGGNCAGFEGATIAASHSSLSDDATCLLSETVNRGHANGVDPHLSGLGNYGGPTLVIMPEHNSPAIDNVLGANAPMKDQRGQDRPANGGFGTDYDIGAVERQPGDNDWTPWLWLPLLRR